MHVANAYFTTWGRANLLFWNKSVDVPAFISCWKKPFLETLVITSFRSSMKNYASLEYWQFVGCVFSAKVCYCYEYVLLKCHYFVLLTPQINSCSYLLYWVGSRSFRHIFKTETTCRRKYWKYTNDGQYFRHHLCSGWNNPLNLTGVTELTREVVWDCCLHHHCHQSHSDWDSLGVNLSGHFLSGAELFTDVSSTPQQTDQVINSSRNTE